MAEDARVELDPESIDAGERLVKALEDEGVGIAAAFWMLGNSYADWRLALSTSTYEAKGRRAAVEEVQRLLGPNGLASDLDLERVLLLSRHDAKVKAFGLTLFSNPRTSNSRRIYGVSAGPEFIDRAYVYRLAA